MPNNISAFSKITKLWMHIEDHLLEWKKKLRIFYLGKGYINLVLPQTYDR